MYHDFYGLKQAPFKITPDTRLFFPGGSRGEILEALVYAIRSGEGITKVVGEVGSGKTMLCRMLDVRLPKDAVDIVYLPNPSLTPEDILHAISLELGLKLDPSANRIHAMQALHQFLLEKHADNKRVVVFVEEAQSMPLETLEEIRLLSNLETQQDKLLQIVLFGQPELDRNLNARNIRQLRERITHSFDLPPLTPDDIQQYVRFRLHAVGYRGPDVFDSAAYKVIADASKGLTRRVNILADKCMLAAFAENTHNVSRKHAEKAIADSELGTQRSYRKPILAVAALLLLAAIGTGVTMLPLERLQGAVAYLVSGDAPATGLVVAETNTAESVVEASSMVAVAEAATVQTVAVDETPMETTQPVLEETAPALTPVVETEVSTLEPVVDAVVTESSSAVAQVEVAAVVTDETQTALFTTAAVTEESAAVMVAASETAETVVASADHGSSSVSAVLVPTSDTEPAPSTFEDIFETAEVTPTEEAALAVEQGQEAITEQSQADEIVASISEESVEPEVAPEPVVIETTLLHDVTLLEQRLSAAKFWLEAADGSHFTIQLLATDISQDASLEEFLQGWRRTGKLEKIYIYKTKIRGGEWFGVLYNDYATFAEAQAALNSLPAEVKRWDRSNSIKSLYTCT